MEDVGIDLFGRGKAAVTSREGMAERIRVGAVLQVLGGRAYWNVVALPAVDCFAGWPMGNCSLFSHHLEI